MKKTIKILAISLLLALSLSAVSVSMVAAGTSDAQTGLTEFQTGATDLVNPGTVDKASLQTRIGEVVQLALSFLGILAVILILYGGFTWMTAGGDTGKVDKAKKWIINATIGIIIILGAYILTSFIITETTTVLT